MINISDFDKTLRRMDKEPLSELIQRNRDKCKLDLATNEKLTSFSGHIDTTLPPKKLVDPYWFIHIQVMPGTIDAQNTVHLVGASVITSDVVLIDWQKKLVRTRNSFYAIGDAGSSDVPLEIKLCVCAGLHSWNVGSYLGVLHVFY